MAEKLLENGTAHTLRLLPNLIRIKALDNETLQKAKAMQSIVVDPCIPSATNFHSDIWSANHPNSGYLFIPFVRCKPPTFSTIPAGPYFHFLSFGSPTWQVWSSKDTKDPQGFKGEKMIFRNSTNRACGLSTQFSKPLNLQHQALVVQYEVRFPSSGSFPRAFIKLFHKDNFAPETRWIICFGSEKNRLAGTIRFSFRHKNPKTGLYEKKQMMAPRGAFVDPTWSGWTESMDRRLSGVNSLYTLIVR
jgi:hypothetical protein